MAKRKYVFQAWPSVRYGPGGQRETFQHEEQVPEGWVDNPAKLKSKADRDAHGVAEEPKRFASQRASSDPTGGGDENYNGGNPETAETPGATQGGSLGQPGDDNELTAVPPIDDVNKDWITGQLNKRKIVHNPKWAKDKLYQLLLDAIPTA